MISTTTSSNEPFAPGQWFVDRMNPETPLIYRVGSTYSEEMADLFICETWSMNERFWGGGWIFSRDEFGGGVQIAASRLADMERVTELKARHLAEQQLRHRDDEWRSQWDSDREPIKVVRCTCGVGDHAEPASHTTHCFCRGEYR